MTRRDVGVALFAVVVWLVLNIALGTLDTLIEFAITVCALAGLGWACYQLLRVISPRRQNYT